LNSPEDLKIQESKFKTNKAHNLTGLTNSGKGGAIRYTCSSSLECYVAIGSNSIFENNYAEESGGAIHWSDLEPDFDESSLFENNAGWLYGDDIACFAQNLVQIT